jgi:two-component system CheB/CheR fusion protein
MDFPIECCISGWTMLHSEVAIIPDIFADERIPHDVYRQTFVNSLAMTPVGPGSPVASIGVYWEGNHEATSYEIELLKSLASAADLALAGVRAYDDARRARAEAEQANALKDEFLATLSHELRNPLNSIVGFAELLLRSPEASQHLLVHQAASRIHGNAQAQARLINDLLDLSRLQTGKLALERRPLNFPRLVADAVETERAQAVAKQVMLELEVADESVSVNGDPVRLQQLVWNLVNNAVKFTPRGGRVRVAVGAEGGEAVLAVEDTGQGIDPEFLPHVFGMFRQGDGRTTRAHGGLGIGLALVHQLVDLHEGQVGAESRGRGQGACFRVRLPLYRIDRVASPAPAGMSIGKLGGTRILIVDDTEDSVEMLSLLLASEGAIVTSASSGEEALRAAAARELDLIVSDISMPGMDGYELMRALRQSPRHRTTPAIALTGFGRDEDIARARQAGFDAQLTKPIDFPALIRLAELQLGRGA